MYYFLSFFFLKWLIVMLIFRWTVPLTAENDQYLPGRTISKPGVIWSSPDYGRVNILSGTFSRSMQIYGCLSIPLNYFPSSLWEWNTSVQIRHNTSRNLPALISSLMCLRIPHADGRCNLSFWKEKADSSLLSFGPSVSELQTRGSVLTWLN